MIETGFMTMTLKQFLKYILKRKHEKIGIHEVVYFSHQKCIINNLNLVRFIYELKKKLTIIMRVGQRGRPSSDATPLLSNVCNHVKLMVRINKKKCIFNVINPVDW